MRRGSCSAVGSGGRRPALAALLALLCLLACGRETTGPEVAAPCPAGGGRYATRLLGWFTPDCSLDLNRYVNPLEVLGPPDAQVRGGGDFSGFVSLGRGGWVAVEMGACAVDEPGPDVRVYQTVSGEAVTLLAAREPGGRFVTVESWKYCGQKSPGLVSNHCDFDLALAGLPEARYFKIQDGEITPCRRATTDTEGADIDAIEVLHPLR